MKKLIVNGAEQLCGEVAAGGAKNAAVAIIPATVLARGRCALENIPEIHDTELLFEMLRAMGATVEKTGRTSAVIDTSTLNSATVPYELSKHMRASYYFIGSLLGRFGQACVSMPGGCNFGVRPIDQHIKGMRALGAKAERCGAAVVVDAAGLTWQRVEAYGDTTGRRNVLHIMSRERIGQRRGVPLLAPVLESLKQLGRYTDAEITAAVISAMFTVFVKSQNPSDGRPFGEMIPAEELIDNADQSSIELGPGAIIDLNPGEEVQFADPKHPNTGYDDFTNATIRLIGAGLEIPPEVMMKQFTTSYSAARGALNEFWRTCSMQRDWFTDDFCQPVYEEWFAEAVARGRIHAPGFSPTRRGARRTRPVRGTARHGRT